MLPSAAKALSAGRDSGLDPSAAAAPWDATRAAAAAGASLLVSVTKANALEVVAALPSGGFAALRAALLAHPDKVLYGAFPYTSRGLQRFAFFTCVGAGVGGMARGRVALQKGGVAKALEGCAGELFWPGGAEEATAGAAAEALGALPGGGEVVVL